MDGVLEGAALLCACKLACSLLFLPSLAASRSPISFCCCCLLIFTDFLVTVFLSFLCIFESWLTEMTPLGDVIALRFLLFLSHTYGMVLLLTTPLIAVETVIRLLRPCKDGQHRCVREETLENEEKEEEEEEEEEDRDKDRQLSYVVSYLCCLSVWVVVALNVNKHWRLEEVWAAACLHTQSSLVRCLPNLFSPMPSAVNPCWGLAFLSLLMLILSSSTSLRRRHRTSAWTEKETNQEKRVNSGMCVSNAGKCVDPEKTESSCDVHRDYSWNSVQMSASHCGDFVLIPPELLSGKQEHEGTKRGVLLTFIAENHVDSKHNSQCRRGQWGFPRPGVNVMIGFVGVLSLFVLPLNLSVNILLIRTIETLLELCIKSLVSSSGNANNTAARHNDTLL